MEELLNKLREHNLVDDAGYIILETYPNGGYQAVDQETFNGYFGGTDYSYEELVAVDNGYKRFFNKWKELGIL